MLSFLVFLRDALVAVLLSWIGVESSPKQTDASAKDNTGIEKSEKVERQQLAPTPVN